MPINTNISKLRASLKLTQSELAEKLGVSHQSVQKWESGESKPELEKLIKLSQIFGVSLDCIVFDTSARAFEETTKNKEIFPTYQISHDWDLYSAQLYTEYIQSIDEGLDISQYKDLFMSAAKLERGKVKTQIANALFDIVQNAKTVDGYKYTEPSDLAEIRAFSDIKTELPKADASNLKEKIAGAWYGRISGCLLGKPIEGIRTTELLPILKESGNYPMHRYILSSDITEDMIKRTSFKIAGRCYADTIDYFPADDDTNYTVLYQKIIDTCGRSFTPGDVANAWLHYQPKDAYCTAERVAFCNFIKGFDPPASAIYQNAYREWIGAQIRADYFGYINPGDPLTASDMAWRDASISHVKNGIYGEMYVAAAIAIAAVCDNIEKIVETALEYIPSSSRLHEAVTNIINNYRAGVSCDDCFKDIHSRWDEFNGHHWCHTISNCEILVASLLYGKNDFGKSICLAVQTGFDTDCNGATVGSILGMKNGISSIPKEWTKVLHGKLETMILGVGVVEIDSVIGKTLKHIGC